MWVRPWPRGLCVRPGMGGRLLLVLIQVLAADALTGCSRGNPAYRAERDHDGGTDQVALERDGPAMDRVVNPGVDAAGNEAAPAWDLRTGLLGYWNFEEAAGSRVDDVSGNGNHGMLQGLNGQSARVELARGQVLEFPAGAANPGVLVPYNVAIDQLRTFTLAAWVFRTGPVAGTQMAVISRQLGTGARQVWDLAFDEEDLFVILSQETGSTLLSVTGNRIPPVGRWIHVAASFDGGELRLYLDGELVGSQQRAWTFPSSTNPVFIGTNKNMDNDEPMVGQLDDVLLYSVALPAGAIRALAQGAGPGSR